VFLGALAALINGAFLKYFQLPLEQCPMPVQNDPRSRLAGYIADGK
jgi:hypothetical protein